MSDLDWYIEHGDDYPPLTSGDLIALDMHVIAGRDEKESENQLRLIQSIAQDAYRRALEDAADAVKEVRDGGLPPSCHSHPTHQYIENWLRDRAAGVGTKDEPLFACCGEWHSGPPCPCRCGHAYEQHTDSIGCVECKGGSCVKYVGTKDGDDDE